MELRRIISRWVYALTQRMRSKRAAPRVCRRGRGFQTSMPWAIRHLKERFIIGTRGRRLAWPRMTVSAERAAWQAERAKRARLPRNPRKRRRGEARYGVAEAGLVSSSREKTRTRKLREAAMWSRAWMSERLKVSMPPKAWKAPVRSTAISEVG